MQDTASDPSRTPTGAPTGASAQAASASAAETASPVPSAAARTVPAAAEASAAEASAPRTPASRWRVVDIVVTAVLGFAVGLVFWAWAAAWSVFELWTMAFPPLMGLFGGVWVLAGPLAALIVRRPGAALVCELLAAVTEAVLGSHFGATVIVSGLLQGLGAELAFALLRYRRFGLPTALLSGALAGVGLTAGEIVMYYAAWAPAFQAVYAVLGIASSVVIAGLGSWLLMRALARTGALASLSSGRTARRV